ncbi:MAG: glycosyltransferase family 1 protein [Gemmatimonadota bacterium]|nr:glycosyltransferase family 4 protein [Gemmatimonadota bacterium]
MRIGVDATCWANARGYGRFTRELLQHLVELPSDHQFVFFLDGASDPVFHLNGPRTRRHRVRLSEAPTQAASAEGYRSPLDLLRMTRAVAREPLDVFFFPSVYTYFPLPLDLPAVTTIHDTIAERFPELTFATRRAQAFWNAKVRLAVRQSQRVLTVSDFSRRDLAPRLGIDPGRIDVTEEGAAAAYAPGAPEAVAAAAARQGLGPDDRWFTYVGGFNPHKNVEDLVRAHAAVCRATPRPPHLLLVGTVDADVFHGSVGSIRETIAREGTGAWVHWTGFLPDEELALLHTGACAVVLPSACEGFGLPAVEGAACGAPVIATTESPLPELLEGGGRFVTPGDVAGLTRALADLASDPARRDALGRVARARANALSWRRGAEQALASLERAAS